jgi:cytochrome c oxidase assembly protein subunit 15
VSRLPRISPSTYRRVTLVALVALCAIIVTGGAVRLTGSGLGCSDWPGCEQERFVAPLELHPMVEFVNRLITGVVSAAIALAVLGSLRRDPRRRDLTWLSLGLVAGVIGQIVLGAFTVAYELAPPFVMGHFLLSLVLVANAVVLHERASDLRPVAVEPATRRLTLLLLPALAVAVLAGTVVTGTGPHGGDEDARRFGFEIESVTRIHSLAVIAFVVLLLGVLGRAGREGAPKPFQERARQLLLVSCAQAAVGWVQWFAGVPALLVGIHILGATLVWAAACRLVLLVVGTPASVPAACAAAEPAPDLVGQAG